MLFNSWQFLIFFPVVTALYFLLPHKFRWFLLLTASCFFYMVYIPAYILILAATIVVDYFAGIWIEQTGNNKQKRKLFLILSIIANVGFLAFFKYFNFINENLAYLAQLIHWNYPIEALTIILPIGLSFHTFQAMSYTIEVYRGKQKAEKHFGIYALYVMFYPQLVAGPIERPQNLIHQFYEEHYFDYVRVTDGLKLMAWGMFKKVVIADRLAIVANQVFNNATDYTGLTIIIATIFFTFQIFCDFSGYSDIAIGAAQVMGFKLMLNFNRPYFSKSMAEFWRRWHISLSSWFRDYVFMPLERTKGPKWKWIYITFITFILSGLWHGANWTFVLWGGLNGVYITFSLLTRRFRNKLIALSGLPKYPGLYKFVQVGVTFFFICFAIVFFRSRSVSDIFYLLSHSVIGLDFTPKGISESLSGLGFNKYDYITAFISIGFMETVHLFQRSGSIRDQVRKKPAWFRWALYYGLLFCILKFGVFNRTEFIYFQF